MPKGYWIGHITVTDAEAYKEYVERDTPVIEGFGGRFLIRGGSSETPEGTTQERHVVIEFPDYETAVRAYESSEYQEIAEIRRRNAESTIILVEGT
ncbi:DUF1330 domain-containing protein [Histidinibacterium aquaticum]|uniref:DUF1330 domain-containing protein n=1 Tax=Histidinibacterium aquaticum TaxID=2613962 RepID=A0A5J5GJ21_9RHOB|nr:DUF1330 domain-containing protein [Histidinibacterium aquaticum]KAA9008040.1 DUF1330 domain-containing protein [Histidinibacterium aquaticum]